MRKLTFTVYANMYATEGQVQCLPWLEWIEIMSTHEVRGHVSDTASKNRLDAAKVGLSVILGTLPAGSKRENSKVVKIDALALDIDEHTDQAVKKAFEKLSGIEYFVYTTHKHGSEVAKGLDRLRVILPLAEPLLPQEFPAAWKALNKLIGGINDPQTKNISRLYLLPSTFDISKAGIYHSPGRWLTLEDLKTKTPTLVERVQRRLKAIKNADPLADAARKLSRGQPFADEGTRHSTALLLTQWIGYRYQELSDTDLEKIFEKSMKVMPDFSFGDVHRTYSDMIAKINKQRGETQAKNAQCDYSDEDLQKIYDENPEWTREVFEEVVTKQGWGDLNGIRKRWIIQRDGICWFLQKDGTYSPAVSAKDTVLAVSKYLGPTPIPTVMITEKGPKPVNRDLIFSRHAALASRAVADLTSQYTTYEPETETLREAICPLRSDLKAVYNPKIDKWLQVLTGSYYGKILDWLATAPDLTQILCALYFDGSKNSGKTLFAYGVAHLWTDGPPADIGEVIKGFNEELTRCPMVLADEEIPKPNGTDVTAVLRSMLSTTSRSLKRKFRAPAALMGAVRLIITANNEFLLQPPSVTTKDDTLAIAERFLEIEVDKKASRFLANVPRAEKTAWGERGIAEHALWLQENHVVQDNGSRFVVEGDIGRMHRALTASTKWNAFCYEWLINYLMDDTDVAESVVGFVKCVDGGLYVCNQALIHGWGMYLKTRDDPVTKNINAALRAISDKNKKQFRRRNKRYQFYKIDLTYLYAFVESEAMGDQEAISARIKRDSLRSVREAEELPRGKKVTPEVSDARGIFEALRTKR